VSAVVDFAVRYPSGRVHVQDLHTTSGVPVADILAITHSERFPALADDETAWELARDAARTVLDRSQVDLTDISVVIYAGSDQFDLPFWTPAAKVAHHLGIEHAHCFEVANFCNAAATALSIAADRLDRDGTGLALVVTADRLSRLVDRADPAAKALFNFGDAAAAVLVAPGEPGAGSFTLLHSAMRTDPSWSDYYRGERRDGQVVIRRADRRTGLAAAYVANFRALVGRTLDALGAKSPDVAYLLINQGDQDMHQRLLRELDFPAERSVFNYHRLGHMGAADTWIALRQLADEGRLKDRDLILQATSGMGFSWGITALEYRE
jgi:3-oxoacyl-[acyl-carrier-protein] synthase-3